MEKLLTTTEVGKFLKVSDLTVRRYIKEGKLKSAKFGRQHRISEADLREFMASHKIEAPQMPKKEEK